MAGAMTPRPLTEADLPRAVALSTLAGWNQNAADWRLFLTHGEVRALDDGDARCLSATAAVLPFGPDVAWISMVLVREDRRRTGLATALMRWAIERLQGTRSIALDATPNGREVYRRLGFRDAWGFTRWRLDAHLPEALAAHGIEWPSVLAMDEAAFGAPRGFLLHDFSERRPQAAFRGDNGYVLARDGERLAQIGPVVATDARDALALIATAHRHLGAPALLDIADSARDVIAALQAAGAQRLRPFTRMVLGAPLPGDPTKLFAMAGPEFG
jgi:GNAT superfamily N-acetyltransferase